MGTSLSRAGDLPAHDLLRALPHDSLLIDADWTVRWINPALARRSGIGIGEAVGKSFLVAFAPGLRGDLGECFAQAMRDRVPQALERQGVMTGGRNMIHIAPLADGGLLVIVQDVEEARRAQQSEQRLLAEHALLARVAAAIARNSAPAEVFDLVCREMATLLGVEFAGVGRTAGEARCEVVAVWSRERGSGLGLGFYDLEPTDEFARLKERDGPVWSRVADGSMSRHFQRLGLAVTYSVPIRAAGRLWGLLMTGSSDPTRLDGPAARRQADLCDLLGVAISNAQAREELLVRATTDSLTGLTNHRTFHERLVRSVAASRAGGEPLSVALFDLDSFRAVNEALGHAAGDRLLTAVAAALQRSTRPTDVVARLGGDEFGVVLPGLDQDAARSVVDRSRRAMAAAAAAEVSVPLSVSAGVCDAATAPDAARMFDRADGALYWAKGHGRDATCIFDPAVVRELNAAERVASLERSKRLLGITALARAIDAKDAATHRHAERVARLAVGVAKELGMSRAQVDRLEQAALVHDVGKIGVPDSILLKRSRLEPDEAERMRGHAALGARMVEEVLEAEQVRWIRDHHERQDGSGYPEGLGGADIDLATAVLSLCDAWDVMLVGRAYQPPRTAEAAMTECERQVGRQFHPAPVAAMRSLLDSGRLADLT